MHSPFRTRGKPFQNTLQRDIAHYSSLSIKNWVDLPPQLDKIKDKVIRRPGLLDMLPFQEYLELYNALYHTDPHTFSRKLIDSTTLVNVFTKTLPWMKEYCQLIYYLFEPAHKQEGHNTTFKTSFYQVLFDSLLPRTETINDDDDDDDEVLEQNNTIRAAKLKHEENERHVRLKAFLNSMRDDIEGWNIDAYGKTRTAELHSVSPTIPETSEMILTCFRRLLSTRESHLGRDRSSRMKLTPSLTSSLRLSHIPMWPQSWNVCCTHFQTAYQASSRWARKFPRSFESDNRSLTRHRLISSMWAKTCSPVGRCRQTRVGIGPSKSVWSLIWQHSWRTACFELMFTGLTGY